MKEVLMKSISGCFYEINEYASTDAENLLNIRWSFCMKQWANSHMLFVPCDFWKGRAGKAKVWEINEFELQMELELELELELEVKLPRVQRRAPLTFYLYFIIIIIIWGSIALTSNT